MADASSFFSRRHMNTPELRNTCAQKLQAAAPAAQGINAFIGLDGFVDEILHVVDKRESAEKYVRLPTIAKYAERLAGAAGKSTNVELVSQLTKLGGNGPIMANAMASFGVKVSYLGNLGYPNIHPVFTEFTKRAEVHSLAEPGYTDALEFEDGKIMLGKHQSLKQINWENIKTRFGFEKFAGKMQSSQFIGFVNWTMLTAMNDIWRSILDEVCPRLNGARRKLFFDLADPEKRTHDDVVKALALINEFEKHFDVILGLNEKEAYEIGGHLGLDTKDHSPEGLLGLAKQIHNRVAVGTILVHPVTYALAVNVRESAIIDGPFTLKPLITTGAGDHFNAGFCLGQLLGLDIPSSVLTGVSTSGFYVRTAISPGVLDLAGFMQNWPSK
jgi:sugar/nucleoside kinase (ribokinase family)